MTAKNNVAKYTDSSMDEKTIDEHIKKEADRLLDAYIKSN
jgi:hypothetical protein